MIRWSFPVLLLVSGVLAAQAAKCTYSLTPGSIQCGSQQTSSNLTMTAGSGCAWTASSADSWIQTSSSGTGNDVITFVVAPNPSSQARTGTITAGGQTVIITQQGTPVSLSVALGATNLVWETGGPYPWYPTNPPAPTFDGQHSAASSNKYVHNSSSWLQTTLVGPGTLTFWWKVDSDVWPLPPSLPVSFDALEFDLNGAMQDEIMGSVDWNYRSYFIPSGTNIATWQYVKDGQYSSGTDQAWLGNVTYQTTDPISLPTALDTCGAAWTSGGNSNTTYWSGQADVSHDGVSAAKSGGIGTAQESWLETTVRGVTNLSFWWKVSSQANYDFLEFYTNSVLARRISGEVAWQSNFFRLPPSANTLRWRFVRSNLVVAPLGQSCAWLDQVTFTPNPPPTILSYLTNLTLSTDTANCQATLPDLTTPANFVLQGGACSSTLITQAPPPGSLLPVGLNTVLLTVADGFHAPVSVTNFTLVQDSTPPLISLLGADTMTNECHTAFVDPGVSITDNCSGVVCTTNGAVNPDLPGSYVLTYVATDFAGNAATNTRAVYVVDTQPPQITLVGPNPLIVECHYTFVDPGASATDPGAGSLPFSVQGSVNADSPGSYSLTYTASDGFNSTSVTRSVQVVDTTAPVVTFQFTNLVLSASTNCQAVLPDLTDPEHFLAQDNCSSVTVTQSPPAGGLLPLGTNEIVLTAVDASGNATLSTNLVLVIDDTPPRIVQPVPAQRLASGSDCQALLPDLTALLEADDNCSSALRIEQVPPAGTSLPLGATNVQFLVSDGNGNTNTSITVVTVQDQTPPVFVQQPVSQSTHIGDLATFTATATACTDVSYQWFFQGTPLADKTNSTFSIAAVANSDSGEYRVVATSAGGSTTSVVATLTVLRNLEAPVIVSSAALPNSHFQFTFTGPEGQTYRVLATSDLQSPVENWSIVASGTFGVGPVVFSDPAPTAFPQRFFRLASP